MKILWAKDQGNKAVYSSVFCYQCVGVAYHRKLIQILTVNVIYSSSAHMIIYGRIHRVIWWATHVTENNDRASTFVNIRQLCKLKIWFIKILISQSGNVPKQLERQLEKHVTFDGTIKMWW